MQFRGGMNELMRQAARMQRKIEQTKQELADKEVEHSAMDGKVKVVVTYNRKVKQIALDPKFVEAEGLDLALDAACAALNGAIEQADKAMEEALDKVTGGVKIPGVNT
jgi:DNA-binding YbaB/EbfC family protein